MCSAAYIQDVYSEAFSRNQETKAAMEGQQGSWVRGHIYVSSLRVWMFLRNVYRCGCFFPLLSYFTDFFFSPKTFKV